MKQPISFQQNKVHYKNYGLLLLICLLAYWPLTFGIFSVKNDAIHYFLPYRFNISEAIRNGEMPFWSPYIYLGYPVYGDMQSGAWNPVVWLFSLIGRYDITLFHFENLLYIFLAGIGMYKLTGRLMQHSPTALLIAVSYMLSGFMLGGQLINWLAAAAFFPFAIHHYLKTILSASLADAAKTGIALYFLLSAGYPSFFIITCYLLLLLLLINVITDLRINRKPSFTRAKFLISQLIVVLVFAALALPAIVSYIDLLPYYARGGGTSYQDTLSNSFEWQHLITLFFPSAIKASDIVSATDITCRNVYIGVIPLIIMAVFPPKLNRRNVLLILLGVFSLLFSMGDVAPIRKLCYDLLPGMNTFRHPSQMRLFFVFALLLLAAPGLKNILTGETGKPYKKRLLIATLVATALVFTASAIAITRPSGMDHFGLGGIKQLLDDMKLSDTIFLNGVVQLLFLAAFLLYIRLWHANKKLFSVLWITNLAVFALFVLPVSFVSSTPAKEINKLIHTSLKGFPVAGLQNSLDSNSRDAMDNFEKISLAYFYNKKIGVSKVAYSPSFLKEQDNFLNSPSLFNYITDKPVVYLADSTLFVKDTVVLKSISLYSYAFTDSVIINGGFNMENGIMLKKISANSFEAESESSTSALFVVTQSWHHHWKVWVDGKPGRIYKTNIAFMGVPLKPGHHNIVFKFIPENTIKAMWVMLATIAALLIAGIISLIRRNNNRP